MSRAAVNTAIENSAVLAGLGLVAGATYAANALDATKERPFVVMRWENRPKSFGDRGVQGLTVWVHDQPGDYTRVDKMLAEIRSVLTSMVHVAGVDGMTVTQIDWTGDSADLWDDGFRTITRNAGFSVVSRPS